MLSFLSRQDAKLYGEREDCQFGIWDLGVALITMKAPFAKSTILATAVDEAVCKPDAIQIQGARGVLAMVVVRDISLDMFTSYFSVRKNII